MLLCRFLCQQVKILEPRHKTKYIKYVLRSGQKRIKSKHTPELSTARREFLHFSKFGWGHEEKI